MSNKVTKRLTKKDILTIPNGLSLVRLMLIPLVLWMYCVKNWYIGAACVILFSTATDIVDGWIARTYHMVSDLGKFLDPVADKLTQVSMIVCLIWEAIVKENTPLFVELVSLLVLFVVRELIMLIVGSVVLKKTDTVNSAKWYGKAATVVLYCAMLALFVFPKMPDLLGFVLLMVCAAVILYALVRYLMFYASLLGAQKKNANSSKS